MTELKPAILQAVIGYLREMIASADAAQSDAQGEANQQSSAMQSRYDTFREEGQYLAGGHAIRSMGLAHDLSLLELIEREAEHAFKPAAVVRSCSLIRVLDAESEEEKWYFLLPAGGGFTALHEGKKIFIITPESPLARAFLGKAQGDEVEVMIGRKQRTFSIEEVS